MTPIIKFWHEAKKTVTALVTGLLGWVAFVIASEPAKVTASEWYMLAVAVAIAVGVYAAPNQPTEGEGGQSWAGPLILLVVGILLGILLVAANVVHVG